MEAPSRQMRGSRVCFFSGVRRAAKGWGGSNPENFLPINPSLGEMELGVSFLFRFAIRMHVHVGGSFNHPAHFHLSRFLLLLFFT